MARRRKKKGRRQPADIPRKRGRQRGRGYTLVAVAAVAVVVILLVVGFILVGNALRGDGDEVPVVTTSGEGATLGSPDAPLTVIEFADFQCPACRRAATTIIPKLEEEYVTAGKVRLEFRHYPFLGEESWSAAEAAECAKEQGKFWEYHYELFNNQRGENSGAFSLENLKGLAEDEDLGLDIDSFNDCLDTQKYAKEVRAQYLDARKRGVDSTPTFFVGSTKVTGVAGWSSLRAIIESELSEGGQ